MREGPEGFKTGLEQIIFEKEFYQLTFNLIQNTKIKSDFILMLRISYLWAILFFLFYSNTAVCFTFSDWKDIIPGFFLNYYCTLFKQLIFNSIRKIETEQFPIISSIISYLSQIIPRSALRNNKETKTLPI